MNTMLFLGVDQSLNGTGLCRLTSDGVERLETVDPGARRGVERLAYVKSRTDALLADTVSFVAVEHYSYNSVGRVFELGEIGGVLRLLFHERGVPFVEVAPAALKKFATGNPSASKEAVVEAARAAGAQAADDNQADAFFLSMIARFIHTGERPSTRARLEVLLRLKNPRPKKATRRIRTLVKNAI